MHMDMIYSLPRIFPILNDILEQLPSEFISEFLRDFLSGHPHLNQLKFCELRKTSNSSRGTDQNMTIDKGLLIHHRVDMSAE